MTDTAAAPETFRVRFARIPPVRRLRDWYLRHRRNILLGVLIALFVAVYLAPLMVVSVPPGHAGVLYRRFGGGIDVRTVLQEGVTLIWPWNTVTVYDVRLQYRREEYEAIARDGLHIRIAVSFRYRPDPDAVAYLHKAVGPDYTNILLVPEVGSITRREVSRYLASEVYGPLRSQIQDQIYRGVLDHTDGNLIGGVRFSQRTDHYGLFLAVPPEQGIPHDVPKGRGAPLGSNGVADTFIELNDVLISDVVLPERVRAAIERKEEQGQLVQEYAFRLERERFESQRKAIEADGIRQFQDKVQEGISDNYLKWRGIEATLKLAASANAKTVVIGGQNGLPLILNTGEGAVPARPGHPPATVPPEIDSSGLDLPDQEPGNRDPMPPPGSDPHADPRTDVRPGAKLALRGDPGPAPVAATPLRTAPVEPVLSPLMGLEGTAGLLGSLGGILGTVLGPGERIPAIRPDSVRPSSVQPPPTPPMAPPTTRPPPMGATDP
ncbi:regulator of protease activity HflC (stomatin/prohibitin superfamily) [Azospirillum agricola]|uniref:prohibitin family protein n=1 Tax=Azospirillum agricola TaxID=1720247 RepID=UPI001AE57106|nr:prohibitin family protein [Azospirillum agricola]MBP2227694.1 regulator of protease activity HflC (stomatin/prohibitin superfamily) [Azospirillum agricola]